MPKKFIALFAASIATFALSAPSYAVCVKVPQANLRHGPGASYEKSWEVYQYMPFRKIGQEGNWYHVEDMDGDKHWVFQGLLSEDIRCAAVNSSKINVRTGPGTSYAKSPLGPVEKYYSFKVLDIKGEWVKVTDSAFDEAWVARRLLWMP